MWREAHIIWRAAEGPTDDDDACQNHVARKITETCSKNNVASRVDNWTRNVVTRDGSKRSHRERSLEKRHTPRFAGRSLQAECSAYGARDTCRGARDGGSTFLSYEVLRAPREIAAGASYVAVNETLARHPLKTTDPRSNKHSSNESNTCTPTHLQPHMCSKQNNLPQPSPSLYGPVPRVTPSIGPPCVPVHTALVNAPRLLTKIRGRAVGGSCAVPSLRAFVAGSVFETAPRACSSQRPLHGSLRVESLCDRPWCSWPATREHGPQRAAGVKSTMTRGHHSYRVVLVHKCLAPVC